MALDISGIITELTIKCMYEGYGASHVCMLGPELLSLKPTRADKLLILNQKQKSLAPKITLKKMCTKPKQVYELNKTTLDV